MKMARAKNLGGGGRFLDGIGRAVRTGETFDGPDAFIDHLVTTNPERYELAEDDGGAGAPKDPEPTGLGAGEVKSDAD